MTDRQQQLTDLEAEIAALDAQIAPLETRRDDLHTQAAAIRHAMLQDECGLHMGDRLAFTEGLRRLLMQRKWLQRHIHEALDDLAITVDYLEKRGDDTFVGIKGNGWGTGGIPLALALEMKAAAKDEG